MLAFSQFQKHSYLEHQYICRDSIQNIPTQRDKKNFKTKSHHSSICFYTLDFQREQRFPTASTHSSLSASPP